MVFGRGLGVGLVLCAAMTAMRGRMMIVEMNQYWSKV